MPRNTHKAVWSKSGTIGHNIPGRAGGAGADFQDALTDEDVVKAVGIRNARVRRDNDEARRETREAKARAKVTLSSPEWLANFMKED